MKQISREITPISTDELYLLQNHYHAQFDYPIHFHPEYEINLVFNCSGKRFIGNSIEQFKNIDLALIGSNVMHAWKSESKNNNARVITLQFSKELFGERLLKNKELTAINNLLNNSKNGVVFTGKGLLSLKSKLLSLVKSTGLQCLIDFIILLQEMSESPYRVVLNSSSSLSEMEAHKNFRILEACEYLKINYQKQIKIGDIAAMVNMTPSAFSHFFKKRTYRSFTDYLIDIRISHVCRLLQETDLSIAQISDMNGFNNICNFNKLFKNRKKITPKEFRKVCRDRQIK